MDVFQSLGLALAAVCGTLAWPLVIFSLALVVLLRYPGQVGRLLGQIKEIEGPGTAIRFGEASVDESPQAGEERAQVAASPAVTDSTREGEEPVEAAPAAGIRWENSGNLFWVGYDLMSGIDFALRGAPRGKILHALRQSWWHVTCLGVSHPSIEGRLAQLNADAQKTPEWGWTQEKRDAYAKELYSIIGQLGDLAASNQAGFDPTPSLPAA